ncbi:MAG: hypothetical protein AAGI37_21390 [Planctomycetota bacterium]
MHGEVLEHRFLVHIAVVLEQLIDAVVLVADDDVSLMSIELLLVE